MKKATTLSIEVGEHSVVSQKAVREPQLFKLKSHSTQTFPPLKGKQIM